jgi:putative DNA-invertase from lambdoid prophage Rac
MPVYSYTRVSTQAQADEGESLGAQQRRVDGYAQMIDLAVNRHFVERGVSGSVPLSQRPHGGALLALVQAGDTIITPKLDRMFRSSLDALDVLSKLKERGVSLHMIDLGGDVTGNGISKLVFTILSAVAEAERDRIRERIADVKKDQKQRGRYLGGKVPFGFEIGADGALVEIPEQQAAIHEMVRLRKSGSPLRLIASVMKTRGHNISHVAVKDILERAMREDVVAPVR